MEDPEALPYASDLTANEAFPLPPLDAFLSDGLPLPENLNLDGADDLGFDFDFSFDDLYLPSDGEDFILDPDSGAAQDPNNGPGSHEARVLNVEPQESNSSNLGHGSPQEWADRGGDVSKPSNFDRLSGDRSWDTARVANSQSPESVCCGREVSRPASSQGSGNCCSGVSEPMNSPSQHSGSGSECGSGSAPSSPDLEAKSPYPVDYKVKLEDGVRNSVSKRKKEQDEGNVESRISKFRRSANTADNGDSQLCFNSTYEVDEKRKARLMRNRESAQLSRLRKKHYVEELEDKVRSMHSTIQDLNSKVSYIMAENAGLRQQLSGGGMCPAPPPGMYPHPPVAPMAYPWMPCAPYVVKSQGSQVPLVPIPRLKPQQTASATKLKKADSKKTDGKTKKVASVSFLGLLFFVMLFGGLVPMFNVKYGGFQDVLYGSDDVGNRFYDHHHGRVLTVNSHVNGSEKAHELNSSNGKYDFKKGFDSKLHCERGQHSDKHIEQASQPFPDGCGQVGNGSEPLVASLFVPRNDKLVKIDGNLIIHSVLASEKAMATRGTSETENRKNTGLAIPGKVSPAYAFSDGRQINHRHPYVYSTPLKRKKALTSGSADNSKAGMKSSAADGKLQEWFREGHAGPMLSSGMCTEVFRFDVSPASAPGGMIPASSVANVTAKHHQNNTQIRKGKNRRILHGRPIPLPRSNLNVTDEHVEIKSQKEGFEGNKSDSSMVVSVLVDPREASDRDSDGIMRPKSLPRIFVVVLLDSVKYVTYSCVLPLKGSALHLVTH